MPANPTDMPTWPWEQEAIVEQGSACSATGLVGCAGRASQQRLRCDGQTWQAHDRCPDHQRCRTIGYGAGECADIAQPWCTGATPGEPVCVGANQVGTCGPDLLTTEMTALCTAPAPICSGGSCTCENPCDGKCTDLMSDPQNCGSCGRTCARGCRDGGCEPSELFSGGDYGNLQVVAGSVYWYDWAERTVVKANLDGSNRVVVTSGISSDQFQVDSTSVYASGEALHAVPRNGGSARVVVAISGTFVLAQNSTRLIFWDGAALQHVAKSGGGATMIGVTEMPGGVAADESTVYWSSPNGGSVRRASLSGGSVSALATGQETPYDVLLAGDWVIWTARSGLSRVPRMGGTPEKLGAWSYLLESDASHLYTTTGTGGAVLRLNLLDPVNPLALAQRPTAVHSLSSDAGYVYWVESLAGTTCPCRVMRLEK